MTDPAAPAASSSPPLLRYLLDLAGAPPVGRRMVLPDRSGLAQLRRSLSYPDGIAPDAVLHLGRFTGPHDPHETDRYLFAALFALWHTSNAPGRPGRRLGSALRQLAQTDARRADTQMHRLLTTPRRYIAVPSRAAVSALANAAIPLHWAGLYYDLCGSGPWLETQRRWAHQYWSDQRAPSRAPAVNTVTPSRRGAQVIVELHALQYFPVNNLNRDDTGAPKTTTLGGETRARWSTQSQKRLMREAIMKTDPDRCGTRTRWLPEHVAAFLVGQGHPYDEAVSMAAFLFTALGFQTERDDYGQGPDAREGTRTNVLIFCRTDSAARFAAFLHEHWAQARDAAAAFQGGSGGARSRRRTATADAEPQDARKVARAQFETTFGQKTFDSQRRVLDPDGLIDIALFGRMLSELPGANVDAAVNVAHAVTTHTINLDFDYYTAIDDGTPKDLAGVGMIGVQPYTSGVYYRYLSLDIETLATRLGDPDQVRYAAEALGRTFLHLRPRAKATNSAPFTRPGLLLAVAATAPHNLASAFVRPVEPGRGGLLAASADALARHWNSYVRGYSTPDGQPPFRDARYSILNPDVDDLPDLAFDHADPVTLADKTISAVLDSALG